MTEASKEGLTRTWRQGRHIKVQLEVRAGERLVVAPCYHFNPQHTIGGLPKPLEVAVERCCILVGCAVSAAQKPTSKEELVFVVVADRPDSKRVGKAMLQDKGYASIYRSTSIYL
jgi:hypothetical protein